MTTGAMTQALALVLPNHVLEHFDITGAELVDEEVRLTLVEKNDPPEHAGTSPVHFHSYRDIMISDFPIRGKPSVITFRRRYWKVEGEKELLANDIPLAFPGTKLEAAFASFLKAGGRDQSRLLGEYRDFKSD